MYIIQYVNPYGRDEYLKVGAWKHGWTVFIEDATHYDSYAEADDAISWCHENGLMIGKVGRLEVVEVEDYKKGSK